MVTQAQIAFFKDNYEILKTYSALPGQRRVLLGQRDVCRYCGNRSPGVTFRKNAHAFPEFIGNHSHISKDECDACNAFFGEQIESHFGAYLGASRTVGQIRGKRGVPKYKGPKGASYIEGRSGILVKESRDEPFVIIDAEKKRIRMKTVRQPYVPVAVYKCLVKTAIAGLPEAELPHCAHTIQWLTQRGHSASALGLKPVSAYHTFLPGPLPIPGVRLLLMRRKNEQSAVPYIMAALGFGNHVFQFIVYCPAKDNHLTGKALALFYIPLDADPRYGHLERKEIDLSRDTEVVGEEYPIVMMFESMEMKGNEDDASK